MQVKCNLAIQAQRQNEKEYNILFHFASASSTSFCKAQQRGTQREAREVETSKKPWTHFNFFTTYHKYPPKSDCEQLGMRQILPNTQQDLTWGWGGEVWGWLCWITWGGSAHYPIFLQGVPPPPRVVHIRCKQNLYYIATTFSFSISTGLFVNCFFIAYMLSPRFCHRFVGYLEEEAVKTYTYCLKVNNLFKLTISCLT